MSHHCHARGCEANVPPRMLMCLRHWRMVPQQLKQAVYRLYVPGQEVRKDPTRGYLAAADAACKAVWKKEATKRKKAAAKREAARQETLW